MYVLVWIVCLKVLAPVVAWIGNALAALTISGFLAALAANACGMVLYRKRPLLDIGLRWNSSAAVNAALGLAGGAGAALLAIGIPLLAGASRLSRLPNEDATPATVAFVVALLLLGAAGEEMFFRGYGFQALVKIFGPWATVVPVGVLFALLHAANPSATPLALANTAGFGILFGYAFLRTGGMWMPIGLHFGWNVTLPALGVNVSGFTMRVTDYAVQWTGGEWWSGGEYGVEASAVTTAVLLALGVYVWKGPVRRQKLMLIEEG